MFHTLVTLILQFLFIHSLRKFRHDPAVVSGIFTAVAAVVSVVYCNLKTSAKIEGVY